MPGRAGADHAAKPAQTAAPSLLVVGALAEVVEDQMRRLFAAHGHRRCGLHAAAPSVDLPAVGPCTRLLLAQPFLADTARALEARGAVRLAAPFPLGAEGTTAWLQAAAAHAGVPRVAVPAAIGAVARPRRRALEHARAELAGKTIFFFPDSQLEIPLARFCARELGMQLVEVGTPYLHRAHLAPELALLPDGTMLSEGQDVDRQLDRCRAAAPDLAVCGLGLANPLEAEGIATKWSIELLFTPIQGYDQAPIWPSCSRARWCAA